MNERDVHAFNQREEVHSSSELFPDRYGAGGEPLGEPTAPSVEGAETLGGLSQELVDDAVDRADCGGCWSARMASGSSDEVIDELLAGASTEEEIAGPGGLLAQLTKRLVERAMEVELTDHRRL